MYKRQVDYVALISKSGIADDINALNQEMAARAREIERLCNALHNVNDNVSYTRQQVKANSKRLAALEQSQAAYDRVLLCDCFDCSVVLF